MKSIKLPIFWPVSSLLPSGRSGRRGTHRSACFKWPSGHFRPSRWVYAKFHLHKHKHCPTPLRCASVGCTWPWKNMGKGDSVGTHWRICFVASNGRFCSDGFSFLTEAAKIISSGRGWRDTLLSLFCSDLDIDPQFTYSHMSGWLIYCPFCIRTRFLISFGFKTISSCGASGATCIPPSHKRVCQSSQETGTCFSGKPPRFTWFWTCHANTWYSF